MFLSLYTYIYIYIYIYLPTCLPIYQSIDLSIYLTRDAEAPARVKVARPMLVVGHMGYNSILYKHAIQYTMI